MACIHSSIVMDNCRLYDNRVVTQTLHDYGFPWLPKFDVHGGGIYLENSKLTMVNSQVYRNSVTPYFGTGYIAADTWSIAGGGIYAVDSILRLFHCTLSENQISTTARSGSPGIHIQGESQFQAVNCLLWNDTISNPYNLPLDISYCVVPSNHEGMGNIHEAPVFLNPEISDFRLEVHSAGVDSGTFANLYLDFANNPRPVDFPGIGQDDTGSEFDMGAFEVPIGGFPTWTPTFTPSPTPTRTPTFIFDMNTDGVRNAHDLLEVLRHEADGGSEIDDMLFNFAMYWGR